MKERKQRLKAIREIIQSHRIESQEVLLDQLKDQGFSVTQATLSRDLKVLKVGKISDGWNGYHYTLPAEEGGDETEKEYVQDILRGFSSIAFSGNLAVFHTLVGHADTVALALDNLQLEEIIGTIAGDDTILIILKEGGGRPEFIKSIKSRIPSLEIE